MKNLLAVLALSLLSLGAFAQDVIVLKGKVTVQGTVLDLTPEQIVFTRADEPEGTVYRVDRKRVKAITFGSIVSEALYNRRTGQPEVDLATEIPAKAASKSRRRDNPVAGLRLPGHALTAALNQPVLLHASRDEARSSRVQGLISGGFRKGLGLLFLLPLF